MEYILSKIRPTSLKRSAVADDDEEADEIGKTAKRNAGSAENTPTKLSVADNKLHKNPNDLSEAPTLNALPEIVTTLQHDTAPAAHSPLSSLLQGFQTLSVDTSLPDVDENHLATVPPCLDQTSSDDEAYHDANVFVDESILLQDTISYGSREHMNTFLNETDLLNATTSSLSGTPEFVDTTNTTQTDESVGNNTTVALGDQTVCLGELSHRENDSTASVSMNATTQIVMDEVSTTEMDYSSGNSTAITKSDKIEEQKMSSLHNEIATPDGEFLPSSGMSPTPEISDKFGILKCEDMLDDTMNPEFDSDTANAPEEHKHRSHAVQQEQKPKEMPTETDRKMYDDLKYESNAVANEETIEVLPIDSSAHPNQLSPSENTIENVPNKPHSGIMLNEPAIEEKPFESDDYLNKTEERLSDNNQNLSSIVDNQFTDSADSQPSSKIVFPPNVPAEINFDDIPIKTNNQNNAPTTMNFDDIPIKPNNQYRMPSEYPITEASPPVEVNTAEETPVQHGNLNDTVDMTDLTETDTKNANITVAGSTNSIEANITNGNITFDQAENLNPNINDVTSASCQDEGMDIDEDDFGQNETVPIGTICQDNYEERISHYESQQPLNQTIVKEEPVPSNLNETQKIDLDNNTNVSFSVGNNQTLVIKTPFDINNETYLNSSLTGPEEPGNSIVNETLVIDHGANSTQVIAGDQTIVLPSQSTANNDTLVIDGCLISDQISNFNETQVIEHDNIQFCANETQVLEVQPIAPSNSTPIFDNEVNFEHNGTTQSNSENKVELIRKINRLRSANNGVESGASKPMVQLTANETQVLDDQPIGRPSNSDQIFDCGVNFEHDDLISKLNRLKNLNNGVASGGASKPIVHQDNDPYGQNDDEFNQQFGTVSIPLTFEESEQQQMKTNVKFQSSDFDFLDSRQHSQEALTRDSILLRFDPLLGRVVAPAPTIIEEEPASNSPLAATKQSSNKNNTQSQSDFSSSSVHAAKEGQRIPPFNFVAPISQSNFSQPQPAKQKLRPTVDAESVVRTSPARNRRKSPPKTVETTTNGTMSVGLIHIKSECVDGNPSENTNNMEHNDHRDLPMVNLERQIKVELLKSEDAEKKLIESEQRVETLIRRISEKDKSITKMNGVMGQYEKAISELVAEKEQIVKSYEATIAELRDSRDTNFQHLSSLETTFSDLHSKYERSKVLTTQQKESEATLKAENDKLHELLSQQEQRYDKMKQHAVQQLDVANNKLELLTRTHGLEMTKLKAHLKTVEISRQSAVEQLTQKNKENDELIKICDELINGQGS